MSLSLLFSSEIVEKRRSRKPHLAVRYLRQNPTWRSGCSPAEPYPPNGEEPVIGYPLLVDLFITGITCFKYYEFGD